MDSTEDWLPGWLFTVFAASGWASLRPNLPLCCRYHVRSVLAVSAGVALYQTPLQNQGIPHRRCVHLRVTLSRNTSRLLKQDLSRLKPCCVILSKSLLSKCDTNASLTLIQRFYWSGWLGWLVSNSEVTFYPSYKLGSHLPCANLLGPFPHQANTEI